MNISILNEEHDYILELNVDGHFPKDFADLVKVAFKETGPKELDEFEQWLNSQPKNEKSRFLKIIEGILLEAQQKDICTAEEFIREESARAEYRLLRLKKSIQTVQESEPGFAPDSVGIKHLLMMEIEKKKQHNNSGKNKKGVSLQGGSVQ